MRFAFRLVLIALFCFVASGIAPSRLQLGPAKTGRENAIAALQSALTAAAARAKPIVEGFVSVDPARARLGRPVPTWSRDTSPRASVALASGARDRAPTDQRRAIQLTCHGAWASHSSDEPPEPPRLSS